MSADQTEGTKRGPRPARGKVPQRLIDEAQDRTARLHNEQVAADEQAYAAELAADAPVSPAVPRPRRRSQPVETETETGTDDWEKGAATYSAAAAEAPETPPPAYTPPEYGRTRVYPTYAFPVYQSDVGGIGLDQEITVTDWDKQGAAWAEAEARRQVTAALGEPSDDAVGGRWWMGRPKRDAFRWRPAKGTPRSAKPFDGLPKPPPWQPWRPSETETAPVSAAETWPEGHERDITPAEYDRRVAEAEAAGMPFVLRAADVRPGDQVLDGEELARVTKADDSGITIDYGYEKTPGVPGSRYLQTSEWSLQDGQLRKVPADATYASLEDRRPPAEQAARYAERRAHYDEQHGPGKRGKKGWTAHKRGCRSCADIDAGGDGAGRQLHVVKPIIPPVVAPVEADPYPVRFTFTGGRAGGGDGDEVRHWAFESALDALRDHVGGWVIPDDGTGVLDTDSFISSIGGYVQGVGRVLGELAERLGGGQTPIALVVGDALAEFSSALEVMSDEAGVVYQQWRDNPDNAHDLRRAEGHISAAHLFNVA